MYSGKILIVAVILGLSLLGCAKKSKQAEDKEFTQMPQTSDQSSSPKGSDDIFDEFYKDDAAAAPQQSQKSARTQDAFSPSASSASYSPQFSETGRYAVQISTVRSRTLADELAAQLNAKGYPAYVADVENPTPALSGTFYRVRIGGFNLVRAARTFGESILRPNGYDYWVDNRSNDHVGIEGYGQASGAGSDYAPPAPAATSPSTSSGWDSPVSSVPAAAPAKVAETPVQPVVAQPAAAPPKVAETPVPVNAQPTAAPVSSPAPAVATPAPSPAPSPAPAAAPAAKPKATDSWGDEDWGDTTGW